MKRKHNLNFEMRCLHSLKDEEDNSCSFDLLQAYDGLLEELPEGVVFRSKDEVLNMSCPREGSKIWKHLLKHMLETLEGSEPDLWEAHCRRGEALATVKWMAEKMLAAGDKAMSRIPQHLARDESVIFRAKAAQGYYCLKAAPIKPEHSSEAANADCAPKLLPDAAAQPVAIHAERRWILTKDFGSSIQLAPKG